VIFAAEMFLDGQLTSSGAPLPNSLMCERWLDRLNFHAASIPQPERFLQRAVPRQAAPPACSLLAFFCRQFQVVKRRPSKVLQIVEIRHCLAAVQPGHVVRNLSAVTVVCPCLHEELALRQSRAAPVCALDGIWQLVRQGVLGADGRAALGWGVRDLAEHAGLAANTVSRFENDFGAHVSTLKQIQEALEKAGIEFIPAEGGKGPGVRLSHEEGGAQERRAKSIKAR